MSKQAITNFTFTNIGVLSTANPNRDGTGTIVDIVPAVIYEGGVVVSSVTIKAQGNTTAGMVRLFLYNSTANTYNLLREISVDEIDLCTTTTTFSSVVDFPSGGLKLGVGFSLRASTQKGESFNVIAEGIRTINLTAGSQVNNFLYRTFNTNAHISTANTNRNGTGSGDYLLDDVSGFDGIIMRTVTIAAQSTTSQGMVRFFMEDVLSNKYLLQEVPIPAVVPSATNPAFSLTTDLPLDGFDVENGYKLFVTTENSEVFNVVANGIVWNNTFPS